MDHATVRHVGTLISLVTVLSALACDLTGAAAAWWLVTLLGGFTALAMWVFALSLVTYAIGGRYVEPEARKAILQAYRACNRISAGELELVCVLAILTLTGFTAVPAAMALAYGVSHTTAFVIVRQARKREARDG